MRASPVLICFTCLSALIDSQRSRIFFRKIFETRSPLCSKITFKGKSYSPRIHVGSPKRSLTRYVLCKVMLWSIASRIDRQQAENLYTWFEFSQREKFLDSFRYYRNFSRLNFADNYNFVGRCEKIAKGEQRFCCVVSDTLPDLFLRRLRFLLAGRFIIFI